MATTTLTLGITSDISSDVFDISTNFNVTTDGSTGVSETTGVARLELDNTITNILDLNLNPVDLTGAKAVLYIKNCDTVFTDYVDLKIGNGETADQHAEVLRIYGGQFAILPLANSTNILASSSSNIDADISVKAATSNTIIEYALFYEA